jgi:DNA-binding NarL/FixJ family response regulator
MAQIVALVTLLRAGYHFLLQGMSLLRISGCWPDSCRLAHLVRYPGRESRRMPTKILIADDDATIRSLLRRFLEKQPDWQVCGEASNGAEAIEIVEELEPDVVVMDLGMPVMTGLQASPEIAKAHPRIPMLLISVQEVSKQLARKARNAGYRGAVTKSRGHEVVRGIEAVLHHEASFYVDDGSTATAQELTP